MEQNNLVSLYISRENHSYFWNRKLFAHELEILEMLWKQAMFMDGFSISFSRKAVLQSYI